MQPFRELMIPLSGVVKTSLLQRDDKKIFLIGETHTSEFCRDKGFTPLCSIIEEYLQTRTKDEPVDFMLEKPNEEEFIPPSFEETRAICSKRVNTGEAIIGLVRHMVHQYIPPVRSPVLQPVPRTFVELPNARVHWLDPKIVDPITRGDRLIQFMSFYTFLYTQMCHNGVNQNRLTSLYICRSIINRILRIEEESEAGQWTLAERHVIQSYDKDPSNFQTLVFDEIPDRDLFLQSSATSKREFFDQVYETLADSKYFKKCYDGERNIGLVYLRHIFYKSWIDDSQKENTIDFFIFVCNVF